MATYETTRFFVETIGGAKTFVDQATFNDSVDVQGNGTVSGDFRYGRTLAATHTNRATAAGLMDVSGVRGIRVNSGVTATVTGFSGGITGQLIYVIKATGGHTATFQHNAGVGNDKILTKSGSNIVVSGIQGVGWFYWDTTAWYEI